MIFLSAAGTQPGIRELQISIAAVTDIAAVNRLWWELVSEQSFLDNRISPGESSRRRANSFLRRSIVDERMLVARLDGQIIGIATFNEDLHFLDESGTVWVIADVWVTPMMRRRGIATQLVKAAENECKSQGATEVRLQVYATNEAAIRLYTSLGYCTLLYSLRKRL